VTTNNETDAVCVWTYQVDPVHEDEFRNLLSRHWPTLRRLELVAPTPRMVLRSIDSEPLTYVEIFTWGPQGMRPAHEHPDVIPIWEEMKRYLQPRPTPQNVPGMTFPLYQPVDIAQ
jgi:hypothetical protein